MVKSPIALAASVLLLLAAITGTLIASASHDQETPTVDVDLSGYPWVYLRNGQPITVQDDSISLIIVGDVLLGRGVADIADPLGDVSFLFHTADLVVGNLETVIVGDDIGDANIAVPIMPTSGPQPIILSSPVTAPGTLWQSGFTLLSLANNHTLDYGPAGLAETAERLQRAGLLTVGAGPDPSTACQPRIISIRGSRLAFLAFNTILPSSPDAEGWVRADWEETRAVKAVAAASSQADGVIVLMHWGDEYLPLPSATQQRIGQVLADAGADLIVGSHPHVIQGTQTVGQHFIAYSLGNFLFDQDTRETTQGLALRALIDAQGLQGVQMLPIAVGPSPRLLSVQEAAELLPLIQPPATRIGFSCQPDGCISAEVPQTATDGLFWGGQIDLTGDGEPEIVRREKERVLIYQSGQVVFETPPEWRIVDAALGDPNDDGRYEVMLAILKADANAVEWSQPYIVGYRGGEYRLMWGGRAVFDPIQEIEVGDVDGDGTQELVVLEQRREGGKAISVWRWREWSFYLVWRSPEGQHYHDLTLLKELEKPTRISVAEAP